MNARGKLTNLFSQLYSSGPLNFMAVLSEFVKIFHFLASHALYIYCMDVSQPRFCVLKRFSWDMPSLATGGALFSPKNVFFVFEHQLGLHRSQRRSFCVEPQDMFISYTQLTGFVEIWPTGCSVASESSKFLIFYPEMAKITPSKDLQRKMLI